MTKSKVKNLIDRRSWLRDSLYVEKLRGLVLPTSWGQYNERFVRLKITGLEAAPLFVGWDGSITGDYGRRMGALHPESFRRLSFLLEFVAWRQWIYREWFAPGESVLDACYPRIYAKE